MEKAYSIIVVQMLSPLFNLFLQITGLSHLLRLLRKRNLPQSDEELLSSCRQTVRSLLLRLPYQPTNVSPDQNIRRLGLNLIDTWKDVDESSVADVRVAIEPAMHAMELLYPSLSQKPKVLLGVLTATVIWMERHFDDQPALFESFHADWMAGRPGKHPMFKHIIDLLMQLYAHYETYVAFAMVTSYFNFVQAEVHEVQIRKAGMKVNSNAPHYPMWARWQHAVTVLYCWAPFEKARFPDTSAFVQATPDIGMFICHLNDVLSFPKEHMAGERNNPIYLNAQIHRKTLNLSFRDTMQNGLEARLRAMRTVEHDPAASEVLRKFFHGYIQFHLECPRYKYSKEFADSCACSWFGRKYLVDVVPNG